MYIQGYYFGVGLCRSSFKNIKLKHTGDCIAPKVYAAEGIGDSNCMCILIDYNLKYKI